VSELAVDQLLDGKYRMVRLVGQGAWATVYEAINVRIQRRVAIKILNVELATQPELHARFTREAEAATQIDSPFVVTVFDAGTLDDGRPYIVMEFLEGEDLGKRLKRLGRISEEAAATYGIQLLSGLADAHATGILHRDIKPDNLVIVKSKHGDEVLKLVDFGISKPNIARPEMLAMTKADSVLGSPVYMSPEQVRGTRHMDHRSDLYSVGVVLFEALTKCLPHDADNFNELMFKIALEDAPDPRTIRNDLDPMMGEIVVKALARDPSHRFQSATEFRDALVAWAESHGAAMPKNPYATSKIRVRALDGGGESVQQGTGTDPSQTASSVRASSSKVASASSVGAPSAPGSSLDLAPPASDGRKRSPLVFALGGAAVVVLGLGLAFAMTHRRAQAQPGPVTTTPLATATAAPSATISAERTSPIDPPAATTTAAPASTPSTTPAPTTSTTVAGGTASPVAPMVGKHWVPPVKSTSPSPSTTASAASPKPNAVVEGRTIQTTF
jgi:serine/threonine-protein kinase